MKSVNYFAVTAAFVALQVLGFVWYHEGVFGRAWLEDIGVDPANMSAPHPMVWVVMTVATVFKVWLLAVLLRALGVTTLGGGVVWGAVLGTGLLALTLASHHAFAMRPVRQIWIEGSQEVLGFALAGAILAAWPRRGASQDVAC